MKTINVHDFIFSQISYYLKITVKQEFFYSWANVCCVSRRRGLEMFSYGNERNISQMETGF
jgi:hypothetical protein